MVVTATESIAYGNHKPESPPQPLEEESFSSLNKPNSILSLTLEEIQCKSGKTFGSMNMDEFLANIWSVEENQVSSLSNQKEAATNDKTIAAQPSTTLSRQGSLPIPIPLCKKTVDEVWFEIHKEQPQQHKPNDNISDHEPSGRQRTLGEMTLEGFLIKAGVIQESAAAASASRANSQHRMVMPVQLQTQCGSFTNNNNTCLDPKSGMMENVLGLGFSNNHQSLGKNWSGNGFATYQMFTQSSNRLVGESSKDTATEKCHSLTESGGVAKNKKRIIDGPPEAVVERRHRRMIKNRESAARSRARRQAYTAELEVELNQLKEENAKLKEILAETEQKRKQEVMSRKKPTKALKMAERLRTMRKTVSLAW